jgi:hypothetical protein
MKTEMMAAFALVCILLISGCTSQNQSGGAANNTDNSISAVSNNASVVQKVEVFHFHGTHQCYSCITVGALAEKTVNTYFKDELDSGRIVFGHVNAELPENASLVQKYEVTSASLWIGTYYANGTFVKEENVNVWYKISDETGYMEYLKGILEKRLRGELD